METNDNNQQITPASKQALDEAVANSRVRLIGDPAPFFKAFAQAQAEFEPVKKDAKADLGQYGYAYAPLENLLAATLPALNRHGLCLLQPFAGKVGGGHELRTWIAHESGTRLEMETDIPRADKIQQLGSSITYLRRYTVQAALGINGEDDDDGNQADGNEARIQKRAPAQRPAPSKEPPPARPQAVKTSEGQERAEASSIIEQPPMSEEQSMEIAGLFKKLKYGRTAAVDEAKKVTGLHPDQMTAPAADKLIAHLKGAIAAAAAGAAS